MKKRFHQWAAASLLVSASSLWAGVQVTFPKGSYSIRDIVERVEHETPYSIHLPFADEANARKVLPSSMDVDEVFRWISRYYEKNNQTPLHYVKKGAEVHFQKNIKTSRDDYEKLLQKNITLKGRNWRVKDALPTVSDQIGIPVALDLEDKADLKADYHYECTFGEWLEEVRRYWETHNGVHLAVRMNDQGFYFVEEGKATDHLNIQLLGKISTRGDEDVQRELPTSQLPPQLKLSSDDSEEVPQKPKSKSMSTPVTEKRLDDMKPEKVSTPSALKKLVTQEKDMDLSDLPPKPWQPVDRWVEPPELDPAPKLSSVDRLKTWAEKGPLPYMNRQDRWLWMTNLVKPHDRPESVQGLLAFVQDHLREGRGHRAWLSEVSDLDLSELSSFERKALFRDIEESWLKASMEDLDSKPSPRTSDKGWHRHYRVMAGMGSNPQSVGDHPLKTTGDKGQWLDQHFQLDYRYNPLGPWKFRYGLSLDHVLAGGSASEDLSRSGLGFHFGSTRIIADGGVEAVSPFFHYENMGDALTGKGRTDENFWLLGTSVHWRATPLKGRFKKSLSSTDVFMEQRRPRGLSERHFVTGRDLRQESFGLRHRQSWMGASAEGAFGPSLGAFLVHRQGDSPLVEGLEVGLDLRYEFQKNDWNSEVAFEYSHWSRDQAVDRMELSGQLSYMGLPKGELFGRLAFENSDSSDQLSDYSSTRFSLGWEVQW